MYLDHFGLAEYPFSMTPDPRFLFFTESHRAAYDALLYGIRERKGFIELVGEVGLGKTTVCRSVLSALDGMTRTALVLNPALDETQLLQAILRDLGLPARERDRLALIERLNDYLLEQVERGINVAVMIDEAQNLSGEMMEHLRLLSNLETDQRKLLQIVLVGQPELDRRLARPELRQIRQRLTVRAALEPLTREQTDVYIDHRLFVAGGGDEPIFRGDAVRRVCRYARGIPRLINKLCDLAMLKAYADGAKVVDETTVRGAWKEMEGMQ
jgi:general secretion pathway protein A